VRERERETDRQTDRQTETDRERDRERETERETERERERVCVSATEAERAPKYVSNSAAATGIKYADVC
jgi:hypothetical protein